MLEDKLIRHFSKTHGIESATWGGQFKNNLSNNITFFHYVLKE